jgi:hypothetical protein
MDKPLGMHPLQAMAQHVKLPRVVTHDDEIRGDTLLQPTAPQGPFGRDPTMPCWNSPSLGQMCLPRGFICKAVRCRVAQACYPPFR